MNISLEKQMIALAAKRRRPITANLELTPLCNMNCDMCYVRLSRAEMEAKGRLRTAEEWISLAEEMAHAGVLFVLLTGGEPLLFPDFRKLYLELERMGMIVTINTNATLIDEEWAAFFEEHKPRRINVTIYGKDETTYEKLCHYRDGYQRAVRGITLLKKAGISVKINGSVTPLNQADMDAIYALGKALDCPVHMDTYMVPCSRERSRAFVQQARLSPELAAKARVKMLMREMQSDAFSIYAKSMIHLVSEKDVHYGRQMSCQAGRSSFAVNWQGEMRPCLTFSEPSVPVFDAGFEPAWKKISGYTDQLLIHEACDICALRPLCDICAASAACETGGCDQVPQYLCRYAQETLWLLKENV